MDEKKNGDVWVFAEQRNGELHDVSLELLGKARDLADKNGSKVEAVLIGYHVHKLARVLVNHGADTVYVADEPGLEDYRLLPYTHVFEHMIREHEPGMVLMGATAMGVNWPPVWQQESGRACQHTALISSWTKPGICYRWCPGGEVELLPRLPAPVTVPKCPQ